jgi:predicted Zn-dependent peptidase
MVKFDRFTLENGLKVIVHKDTTSPISVINILYNVGARDEDPDKTGFAHLFEHLMFGGSINIPVYDEPLERVGGENNAFTNSDITNYYLTIPTQNLETGFWLESDRMLSLAFSPKSLKVQQGVVTEEYNQSYLNKPYGDVWLLLRPLAYKVHPYTWTTIGKSIEHIENAKLQDVKDFFHKFYCPNNAIMVVAGNVETENIKKLSEKWFAPIPKGPEYKRNLPQEPKQTKARTLTVERNVPYDAIYIAFHICKRMDKEYYTCDVISDILSNGNSSRLYQELVKKQKLFSEINAFISGHFDEGLFIICGKLIKGIKMEDAEAAIYNELKKLETEVVAEEELTKAINKIEASEVFDRTSILNKAMDLAYFELLGDADMFNTDLTNYHKITTEEIKKESKKIFRKGNSSTLYYLAKN